MANEQDDDFFDDDDLDEETLLVLEQAEKHHASISLTASQAPPASSLVNRSTSVPVKSLSSQEQRNAPAFPPPSQYQSRQYQHQPLASQQRASSARPAVPAVSHAVVQPMHQQQRQQQQPPQHFKAPQPVKQYPSSTNGNAVAGPSRYVARQPVKPKYKDDFPDVEIDAHGKGYRVRSSASAAPLASASEIVNGHPHTSLPNNETESLRTQLAEVSHTAEWLLVHSRMADMTIADCSTASKISRSRTQSSAIQRRRSQDSTTEIR